MEQDEQLIKRFETLMDFFHMYKEEFHCKVMNWDYDMKLKFMQSLVNSGMFKVMEVEKVIIKEPEFKMSEDERRYFREYYQYRKEEALNKKEEERQQQRLDKSLQGHKKSWCYVCREMLPIVEPTIELGEEIKSKKKIVIVSKCPKCQGVVRTYGGYLFINDRKKEGFNR